MTRIQDGIISWYEHIPTKSGGSLEVCHKLMDWPLHICRSIDYDRRGTEQRSKIGTEKYLEHKEQLELWNFKAGAAGYWIILEVK